MNQCDIILFCLKSIIFTVILLFHLIQDQDYNVIYSNDNKLNVLSNLWKTNRIKWTNETTFGALPMSHRSTILDCINKRGMSVRLEVKSVAHQLSRNDAANIQCV